MGKLSLRAQIIWGNLAIMLALTLSISIGMNSSATLMEWAIGGWFAHIIILFVTGFGFSLANDITEKTRPNLGKAASATWISLGLVLLLSIPACTAMGGIVSLLGR
ncbi:hypothetical protein PbB2_02939 [Candidatus Phycosocius bacilliformis]|uniref:Uncharacterized protein n=1 Tax=Candidatus Phycosocius bacilliformis TaxID=1445552 RepID=A0A2P2EDV5_9PROT|nr:hypothetical protein [Candidatus Phycosocius bacilliformis]GBF59247.1 hypothetical protein PbB2_02939 [Candidatus Phycosocius bacilliformis]